MAEVQISERNLNIARMLIADKVPYSTYLREVLHISNADSEGRICCPVHEENTPSFHYGDGRKRGHCFGCHVGGTIVELHMHVKRKEIPAYSQYRAILDLAKHFNIELPDLHDSKLADSYRLKKSTRTRNSENSERYYQEKLKQIPKLSLAAPLDVRINVSKTLDNVFLGRITTREGYLSCKRFLGLK